MPGGTLRWGAEGWGSHDLERGVEFGMPAGGKEHVRSIKRDIKRRESARKAGALMSQYLKTRNKSGGTTDHSVEIRSLREQAAILRALDSEDEVTPLGYLAAASLLEVHDSSGISLESFGPVGQWVNAMLDKIDAGPYLPNGV